MALFQKRSREEIERDRILNQEFATLRYKSFAEAIKGEASVGSNDFKVTTIVFPEEREIVVLTMEGKIFLARDTARPVDLATFLFWSDLPAETKSAILMLAHDVPLNEHILGAVAEKTPEALPAIRGAINDATAEAVSYALKNFDSYLSIDTNVALKAPRAMKILGGYGIPFDRIESLVKQTDDERAQAEAALRLADKNYSEVLLNLKKESFVDDTYEGRFLLAAAEVDCSLQDAWDQSAGFSWVAILEKLQELVANEIVELKFPQVRAALPDNFEVVMSYEKLFRVTKGMNAELEPLVAQVFVVSSDLETALRLAEENAILENRVREIEDHLIKVLLTEEYETFEDLSPITQDAVRVLVLDRQQNNAKRAAVLHKLQALVLVESELPVEQEFKKVLNAKLSGIEGATDVVPRIEHEPTTSSFEQIDEPVEFNYRDGLIVHIDGEPIVQEIHEDAEVDDIHAELTFDPAIAFDTHPAPTYGSKFDLGHYQEVDIRQLNDHLERMKAETAFFTQLSKFAQGAKAIEAGFRDRA